MCCSSHDPKRIARLFVRIGFGLALAFVGFAHYQDVSYAEAVSRGLGVLEPLGLIWGYILPGLFIISGLLLAFGIYLHIAAYLGSIALISIPAVLMLKSALGVALDDTMPLAMNAFIWVIVFLLVIKGGGCGSHCNTACCDDTTVSKPMSPMKSVPAAPTITMKSAPASAAKKAVPTKKSPMKKSAPKM